MTEGARRESSPRERLDRDVEKFVADWQPLPRRATLDEHFHDLVDYQRTLHAADLAVVAWPEEFGGRGLTLGDAAHVAQRLGEARMPELANFVGVDVLAPAMIRFADEDRLRRWLPPMASADEIWCQLFSEPDAGSDLAALTTRAVPDGDGWKITGQKVWSTWAQFATWGFLLARTGEQASRHRGITAFVLDMGRPGIEIRPLTTMTGDSEFAEVFFDGVAVGPHEVVGEVDGGWAVALHILGSERGLYAVRRASVIRGVLRDVLERSRMGGLRMADRAAVVEAASAQFLLDRRIEHVVAELEEGKTPGADAAVTKVLLTQAEQAVFTAAMGLLGMAGTADEGALDEVVSGYLYSRAASIYGGTGQIQRNIIGERVLGLPREASGS